MNIAVSPGCPSGEETETLIAASAPNLAQHQATRSIGIPENTDVRRKTLDKRVRRPPEKLCYGWTHFRIAGKPGWKLPSKAGSFPTTRLTPCSTDSTRKKAWRLAVGFSGRTLQLNT
ncbi:MAG: hypothetical protein IPQ01_00490 [Zoogloea sp.]|nr:hypothetical protein [Zoogloea sp.]